MSFLSRFTLFIRLDGFNLILGAIQGNNHCLSVGVLISEFIVAIAREDRCKHLLHDWILKSQPRRRKVVLPDRLSVVRHLETTRRRTARLPPTLTRLEEGPSTSSNHHDCGR